MQTDITPLVSKIECYWKEWSERNHDNMHYKRKLRELNEFFRVMDGDQRFMVNLPPRFFSGNLNEHEKKYVIIGLNPQYNTKKVFQKEYSRMKRSFEEYIDACMNYFTRLQGHPIDKSTYWRRWKSITSETFIVKRVINTNVIPFHSRKSNAYYKPNAVNKLKEYLGMMEMLLDSLDTKLCGIIMHGNLNYDIALRSQELFRFDRFEGLQTTNMEVCYGRYKNRCRFIYVPYISGRNHLAKEARNEIVVKVRQFIGSDID